MQRKKRVYRCKRIYSHFFSALIFIDTQMKIANIIYSMYGLTDRSFADISCQNEYDYQLPFIQFFVVINAKSR